MLTLRRGRRTGPERRRGQALVEFALVFPVFVLVLSGMIDFGVGLFSYMTTINAAREGARLGATACSSVVCGDAVVAKTTAAANGLGPAVTVTCSSTDCYSAKAERGESVRVTVTYTYHMLWPLTAGTQIPMTASVEMMVE